MAWFYVAVGIACLIALQAIRNVLSVEFPKYAMRPVRRPSGVEFGGLDLVDARTADLRTLGFDGPVWIGETSTTDAPVHHGVVHAVFTNPQSGTLAFLGPPLEAAQPHQLLTYYVSHLADGRYAVTQVSDPYFDCVEDPQTPAQTIAASTADVELAKHDQFVKSHAGKDLAGVITTNINQFAETHMNEIRERLINRKWLKETQGIARPSWSFAWRMLRKLLSRPKTDTPSTAVLPPERLAFLYSVVKRAEDRAPSQANQWILLLASSVLSLIIGWPLFGLETTLVIVVVIGFHEYGHWVAMKMAGYKNPHITLLPLLGGVTIGYERDPSATRRAWVALAGPLPGIVLGWILLYFWQTDVFATGWLMPAIVVLLFINYLNILPIPPLDGSHVLQAVLPRRWVAVQIAVIVVGVIIGVYVAAILNFWPLALIAALQLLGLKSLWATAQHTRFFTATPAPADLDNRGRMAWLLGRLEQRTGPATSAGKRLSVASAIERQLVMEPMSALQRVVVTTVYAALLVVPVLALVVSLETGSLEAMYGQGSELEQLYEQADTEVELSRAKAVTMDLKSLLTDLAGEDVLPGPVDEAAFAHTESRLGQALPTDVLDFYRTSDGAVGDIGIGPVTQVRKIDPELFITGKMADFAYEGHLYFYNNEANELAIPVVSTRDWVVLGADEQEYAHVFLNPAAGDSEATIFVFDDFGISSFASVRDLIMSRWVDQQANASYETRFAELQASAAQRVENLSVTEILDRLPEPPLLARLIAGEWFRPGGVDNHAIATAEARIGHPLPGDYREFLSDRNGSANMALLPIENVQPANHSADASAAFAIEIAQETEATSFDRKALNRCWIIAGFAPVDEQGVNSVVVGAQLYWCPEQPSNRRYLSLNSSSFQPTFTAVMREYAAKMLLL